ncbi:type II toxin-antitoxin system HipA family toxinoxin YjjJ [Corallococcus sp. AB049A]|uniref:Type II toxin-antitoxin system HipA family toxinoxin YjjJ n=1 Tax=Corallococcus interemptor TaxID=2316720 RepID=A0A3A8Q726_9BACT|nr:MULTISPECIES: type II toxin-antitoxin system HipA family toxin YjjJ [Corallococcus]RKH50090.1 type II toxin-antitoxin system HipA family toxinoxin YjjJ [Corallococcus sp. AB050B]RKH64513.1 type II toxin-antitoxin system HipA family toxinoxin YjjJ [Corallococcus interemptor]RKI73293.1 type II toxin-antitoxin system HipA family toxinoxin YjjJ [Corallococcus sp. AB049A]
MAPAPDSAQLLEVIRRIQPVSAEALKEHFKVSQQTMSRWLKALGADVCRMGRTRGAKYHRTRVIPSLGSQVPVHRVDEAGNWHPEGTLHFLSPQGAWLERRMGPGQHFEGRPHFAEEMRPQGYMGKGFLQRHQDLALPSRPELWTDDQVFLAVCARGDDCTGNLILGEESLNRFLNSVPQPINRDDYPQRAVDQLAAGAGSSAGGEQPKFAGYSQGRHVLVKFADASSGTAGQRWCDLLVCEYLALEAVRAAGLDAAEAEWFTLGAQRFLEVNRFDRVGPRGRRPLLSLGAIDHEHIGDGGKWIPVSQRLLAEGLITQEDDRRIRWLDTFGQLIGNTDRHNGNISFFMDAPKRFRLAPIYDMLPMVFAPAGGTHLVPRPFEPAPPTSHTVDVWADASRHALAYWDTLIASQDLSEEFRQRCVTCRAQLEELIARVPVQGTV